MKEKSNRLRQLQEQKSRKVHLESLRSELTKQQRELSEKTIQLRAIMDKEQRDVDRLEKVGLVSLVFEVLGKKEQRLEKEKQEAYAARLKYDTALREQESMEARLRSIVEELRGIKSCEGEYEALLHEILTEIKAGGDSRKAEVLRMEQEMVAHQAVIRELSEAIVAGNEALSAADVVLHHLSDAEGWGTWDLLGGGLLADIAKHDALDSAQRAVDVLQVKLRSFKTELVDVNVSANVQISLDGFLSFADFFFDGFFADFAVMDHIQRSIGDLNATKGELKGIMQSLRTMQAQREAAVHSLQAELAKLAME